MYDIIRNYDFHNKNDNTDFFNLKYMIANSSSLRKTFDLNLREASGRWKLSVSRLNFHEH